MIVLLDGLGQPTQEICDERSFNARASFCRFPDLRRFEKGWSLKRPTQMRMVDVPDMLAMVGSPVPLRANCGMTTEAIAAACRDRVRAA